jgi:hypothetical protein
MLPVINSNTIADGDSSYGTQDLKVSSDAKLSKQLHRVLYLGDLFSVSAWAEIVIPRILACVDRDSLAS